MKYSGVVWIGQIPDSWNLIRFKDVCENKKEIAGENSSNYERLALTLNGVIKRAKDDSEGLQPKEFDTYQIIRENDFVFKMIDLQNISTSRVGLSPYTGLVSPAYIRFSPRKENQFNKFTYYFLMSMYYNCVYNNLGGNGVRSALNATDMGRLLIPFPHIDIQKKIVGFLEQKIKQVDDLIIIEQEQIEKLKLYMQSIITEVCSVGLDSKSTKMKKSPLPWLTEIPEHWECVKAKHILKKLERPLKPDDNVVICSNSGKVFYRGEKSFGLISMTENGYQGVEPGDLLIHGMDTWHGAIAVSNIRGKCTSVVHVCETEHSQKFIAYYLRSLAFRNVYKAITNGVRQNTSDYRSWDKAGTIELLIPPISEQESIAKYLDEKSLEIDELIALKEEKIDKLQEYKKSLIYEYVTGKKELI